MKITDHDIQAWRPVRRTGRRERGINKAAREEGLSPATVHKRLSRGGNLEDALSTPVIPKDSQLEMARARIGRNRK